MAGCNPIKSSSPTSQDLKTSDVSIYDGIVLSCIDGITTETSSLNDVIAAADAAICDLSKPPSSEITYDGSLSLASCSIAITPVFNTTVNDAFTSVGDYICNLETALNNRIDNLSTDNITLSGTLVGTDCLGTFTGSDSLEAYLTAMATKVCSIPDPTTAEEVNLYDYESISRGERTWVGVGGDSTHNSGSLLVNFDEARYYINGVKYEVANSGITLDSTSDNYVDYDTRGSEYLSSSVAIGSSEPPTASDSIRVAKYETDGTGVVSYTDLREYQYQDGERWFDASVLTRHIADLNVTGAKLEDFGTAGTNDWSLASFTVDDKGRVQSWTNNTLMTSLSDKDILQYNAGTGNWVNVNLNAAAITAGTIQGETLYWDTTAQEYLPNIYLRNMPNALGIGLTTVPQLGIDVGSGTVQGFALPTPSLTGISPLPIGSLGAGTYYYVVTAIDADGGETLASGELDATVDGVTTTGIQVLWGEVPNTKEYRLYKGTATGVYTEYITTTTIDYVDIGTAGTAGSPPSTNPNAYGTLLGHGGIAIGYGLDSTRALGIKNTGSALIYGIDLDISGQKGSADTYGIKSLVSATTVGTNVAGWFSVSGAISNNYVLRLEDGVDNTGKFLKVLDADGNVGFEESAGVVQYLDDLLDVSAVPAATNDWDTLRYDLPTLKWVTSGSLSNDGDNVAIGDKPGSIDARLHINSSNSGQILKIEDSVVGEIATINASGVLEYKEQFKYTFTNGGSAPFLEGKFLKNTDNFGNAEWHYITEDDITDLGDYWEKQSGTFRKVARWTPDGVTLGDSQIEDWGEGSGRGIGLGDFALTNIAINVVSNTWDNGINCRITESSENYGYGAWFGMSSPTGFRSYGVRGQGNTAVGGVDNIGIGVYGHGEGSSTFIPSGFTAIGVNGQAGENLYNAGDSAGLVGYAWVSHDNDNYGIVAISENGHATGTSYIGIFDDSRTTGADKFLRSIDADGRAEWTTIPAYGVTFNGLTDYVTRWTPDGNSLGTGMIRDNGSTVGINVAPAAASMLFIESELDATVTIDNTKAGASNARAMNVATYGASDINYGIVSNATLAVNSNVGGVFSTVFPAASPTTGIDYGVIADSKSTARTNIGTWSRGSGANSGINIGLHAEAVSGSTNYALQLEDGTQGVGLFLKCITSDGHANWGSLAMADLTDRYERDHATTTAALYFPSTEYTIFADTSSNAVTVSLPAAASNDKRVFVIKKTDAANKVVVDGSGSETIDGALTYEMFGIYDWVKVQSNGTNWFIIA